VANEVTLGGPHRRINDALYARNAQIIDNAYQESAVAAPGTDPLELDDRPFVVGRRPIPGEELPQWHPDLSLDDTRPFRLSRNHFMIERRDERYYLRDLHSTLGTIVNGEPIGDRFFTDEVLLRIGENEVIAGGVHSPFVFSVSILLTNDIAVTSAMSEGRRTNPSLLYRVQR
jgi:pSer/pThr/pTyr-binding forkhead associated (FHA) protein